MSAAAGRTYDMVVVGGGAAGISAAKITARMRRSVLVVDAGAPRNAPAAGVHNYLYAEDAAPGDLAATGRAEARAYGVEILDGAATSAVVLDGAEPGQARFSITVDGGLPGERTVGARRIMLATGLVDVLPDIPGVVERWGHEVLHCPFCHGWEVRDQAIGVLATGPMAVHSALLFRQLSEDVVLFQHTGPEPSDEQRAQLDAWGVRVVTGEVVSLETTGGALSGVRLADGSVHPLQALAVATGVQAREDLVADLGLSLADLEIGGAVLGRYLPADANGATAVPGVWAAGNVATPMAQVIGSAAAGATAGSMVHMDLIAEDTGVRVAARAGADLVGA